MALRLAQQKSSSLICWNETASLRTLALLMN